MRVTVVISTCKRSPKYLRRALESVLNQDYSDIELFIVDDSPNDYIFREDVMNLCLEFKDNHVTYIQNDKQIGACATRNKGADLGKGKYIAFLDDDDFWCSDKISKQVSILEKNPEYGMVYSDYELINEKNGKIINYSYANKPYCGNVFENLMLNNFVGSTSIPLMRRDVFEKVGRFDSEQPAMQDWDLWLRIAEKYAIGYISECLAKYYIHSGEHITKSPKKRRVGLSRINKKYSIFLDNNHHLKSEHCFYFMRLYIAEGNLKEAFKYYWLMVEYNPKNIIQNIVRLKAFGRLFIKPSKGWS